MKRKVHESEALPISMTEKQYVSGVRDVMYYKDMAIAEPIEIKQIVDLLLSDDDNDKLALNDGSKTNFIPSKNFKLTVNPQDVINTKTLPDSMRNQIVPSLNWTFNKGYVTKGTLAMFDILAHNNWKRPIYFASTVPSDQFNGLDKYLYSEGLALRLLPLDPSKRDDSEEQPINLEPMYEHVMNKFKWGGMNKGIYIDPETNRMTINLRSNATRLAESFLMKGEKQKAIDILDLVMAEMPHDKVPLMIFNYRMVELYHQAGAAEKANVIAVDLFDMFEDEARYYSKLRGSYATFYERDMQNAMAIMQEMIRMAKTYQQPDLAQDFQTRFDAMARAN
jgi:hypothetical protein